MKRETEGSIYRTRDGRWRCAIVTGHSLDGTMKRKTFSGKVKSAVIAKRNAWLRDGDPEPPTETLEAFLNTWLDTWVRDNTRPRVAQLYRSHCRRHIIPLLGTLRIGDLTVSHVRTLHKMVRKTGVSDRTVQSVHTTLSSALTRAVREGVIPRNVAQAAGTPRAVSTTRNALSVEEATAVLAEPDELRDLWALLLMTGARRGEALGLEWDRVLLDEGLVDFSWQIQRVPWRHGANCGCDDGVTGARCPAREHDLAVGEEARELAGGVMFTRPKTTRSVRMVPLHPLVWSLLRQRWLREGKPAGGLVWTSSTGGPWTPHAILDRWRDLLDRVGARRVDLHSTRHTTGSLLLDAGVPIEVIRQILGHTDVVMTRGYAHLSQDAAREAIEKLGGALGLAGQNSDLA